MLVEVSGRGPLSHEPLIGWRIAFAASAILLPGEQHAAGELVSFRIPIAHQVFAAGARIDGPHPTKETLREDVIDLRKVVLVSGRVIEVSVPDVEQQVDMIRTIPHVPEAILSQLETAVLRANDAENLVELECARSVEVANNVVDKLVRRPAESARERRS